MACFKTRDVPMRAAMNEILRDWYANDCQKAVERWNKVLARHGLSDRLRVPDRKFNRHIGIYSSFRFDPQGVPISEEQWKRRQYEWLPSDADKAYLGQHHVPPGVRAGQVRAVHRPAREGHQPATGRLRVRPARDVVEVQVNDQGEVRRRK